MAPNLRIAAKSALGSGLILGMFALCQIAQATSFKVLYSFTGGKDGANPDYGSPVIDSAGNLYGTTAYGGTYGFGTAFKLSPDGSESALHSFGEGNSGYGPEALVMDQQGNLFGTACCGGRKICGVIFEIAPNGSESLFHTFRGAPRDGCGQYDALMMDGSGNLYGTSGEGGKHDSGVVFKLAPDRTETLIHSFNPDHGGNMPFASVSMDTLGRLYGTTVYGGTKNLGIVFEITPDGAVKTRHAFEGSPIDGSEPGGGVVVDNAGSLYGTTFSGGLAGCASDSGCGIVFKLGPDGTETVLHFFTGKKGDGSNPLANLITDGLGNLYGTTEYGGGTGCGVYGCGTVFKIATDGTETVLHSFEGASNGANPTAGLVANPAGHFYGTTAFGGQYGYGTIFEVTP